MSYVGGPGYELYVPTEQALHVYDRLTAAGAPLFRTRRISQRSSSPDFMPPGLREANTSTDPSACSGWSMAVPERGAAMLKADR